MASLSIFTQSNIVQWVFRDEIVDCRKVKESQEENLLDFPPFVFVAFAFIPSFSLLNFKNLSFVLFSRLCSSQGNKINNIWNEIGHLCREKDYISYIYSNQMIDGLNPDTYYHVSIRAHNVIGYSIPADFYLKTARGKDESGFANYNSYYAGVSSSTSPVSQLHILLHVLVFILTSFMFSHAHHNNHQRPSELTAI